jgi:hypothetical protein
MKNMSLYIIWNNLRTLGIDFRYCKMNDASYNPIYFYIQVRVHIIIDMNIKGRLTNRIMLSDSYNPF